MNACYTQFRNEIKNIAATRKSSKSEAKRLYKIKNERGISDWRFDHAAHSVRWSGSSKARHLNIAYGLLRGHSYRKIERNPATAPNAEEVWNLISKHSFYSDRKKVGLTTLDAVKKALE